MRRPLYLLTVFVLLVGYAVMPGRASSHREAPMISGDPQADNTDVYAFMAPDRPDGDGVDKNDLAFRSSFPYVAIPHSGGNAWKVNPTAPK